MRVSIDPAHSDAKPGKVTSSPPAVEAEANLVLAMALGEELEKLGYDVHYTRQDGSDISFEDRGRWLAFGRFGFEIHHGHGEAPFAFEASNRSGRQLRNFAYKLAWAAREELSEDLSEWIPMTLRSSKHMKVFRRAPATIRVHFPLMDWRRSYEKRSRFLAEAVARFWVSDVPLPNEDGVAPEEVLATAGARDNFLAPPSAYDIEFTP